ncbi:MAG TPA: alpha-hydroxy-acid oxidizing protein [Acidimicrobiales bacterium]
MATPFGDFQSEIYLRGTTGERPPFTTDLAGLEDAAREALPPEAFGYVAGSAGSGATARANRRAFDRWRIVPRMLRDVAERDLTTVVLGTPLPAPVLLAPVGVQTIVHPDGELASARAAGGLGLTFVHSTAADVIKALALGAAAVLYGRPYIYGLGLGGQAGVEHVLRCLLGELDVTLALSGHRRLAELGPHVLAPAPE